MTFFLPGRQRIGAHALCVQRSPTAATLSASFLLNHAPNSPEHWLQDLRSHTAAWVMSQKDWRNQGSTSWILAMHWCSIWVKKCDFRVSLFCQSAEAQVIWGGRVKRLLIAYFIGNISAKEYQNAFTYVKVRANHGTFFETQCIFVIVFVEQSLSWASMCTIVPLNKCDIKWTVLGKKTEKIQKNKFLFPQNH